MSEPRGVAVSRLVMARCCSRDGVPTAQEGEEKRSVVDSGQADRVRMQVRRIACPCARF